MPGTSEIRARMKSVEQTLKITNAMYLISSANLRRAREQLARSDPYFTRIRAAISDIIHRAPQLENQFFDRRPGTPADRRKVGFVVVSGDKGLAGAYNHNVLKTAERRIRETPCPQVLVAGLVGRAYFQERGIPVCPDFTYVVQDPNMHRARRMGDDLVQRFLEGELDEVRLFYTEMVSPLRLEVREQVLLPLSPENFPWEPPEGEGAPAMTYVPSADGVLNHIVPEGYVRGVIFGALVEAFCAEQSARMTAMETASDNGREMLKGLSLTYNRARQAAITQEITEIAGASREI